MNLPARLYYPAYPQESLDFSERLNRVATRLRRGVEGAYAVHFETRIHFGDDRFGRIVFGSDNRFDEDSYLLSISRVLSIDEAWEGGVVKNLLEGVDEDTLDAARHEVVVRAIGEGDKSEGQEVETANGDTKVIRGFLEHDTIVRVSRSGGYVCASKAVTMNVLDTDLSVVNAHMGFSDGVYVQSSFEEIRDLELLYEKDESPLDAGLHEAVLSLPTPADYIICTNALIGAGQLSPRTHAFRGAGPYMNALSAPHIFS